MGTHRRQSAGELPARIDCYVGGIAEQWGEKCGHLGRLCWLRHLPLPFRRVLLEGAFSLALFLVYGGEFVRAHLRNCCNVCSIGLASTKRPTRDNVASTIRRSFKT